MKAILVGVCIGKEIDFKEKMEEMVNLADACDIEIIQQVTQNLNSIHKRTYINSGKLEEVKNILEDETVDVDTVIFDTELAPAQLRNIEEILEISVIDKTNLILRIFDIRAKTREARLQVEIAKLRYQLPRLRGTYEALDKQGGGLMNKGTGEKKLDLDARHIAYRIECLNKELKDVIKTREVQRKQRQKKDVKSVALVGYTNAGKSSTMNQIMHLQEKEDKKVFEENMLFATLTTNTRNVTLKNARSFVLSDTVGFVSDLPHTLIKAFQSTLEEVVQADLLLHIMDISNPEHAKQKEITLATLDEIEANEIPILNVYNKCDLSEVTYPMCLEDKIYISSKDNDSIELLLEKIDSMLFKSITTTVFIPYDKGSVVSFLNNNALILDTQYEEHGTLLEIEIEQSLFHHIEAYIKN